MSSGNSSSDNQKAVDKYYAPGATAVDKAAARVSMGMTPTYQGNQGGGGSSYSSSAPVTDMSQWYRNTQASQGNKPTADQVSAAMNSYKGYVAGKTNPNSGVVWNQYGEKIGNNGTSSGGYTDFSWQGANAIVDPNRTWNTDARNNLDYQRQLTGTPLTSTYLDYNTNQWGTAPKDYQTGKANSPGFINYAQLGTMADNWLENNPGSMWDKDGLSELWQGRYSDLPAIPGMMSQYANEFSGGVAPGNFQYDPNNLYGNARTGTVEQMSLTPAKPDYANQAASLTPPLPNNRQPWELALDGYKTNPQAGYDEIARAGQVYNQKMAAGDIAGANAAHTWANQIRDAIGVSGQYDRTTGALLGAQNTSAVPPLMPPAPAPFQNTNQGQASQNSLLSMIQTVMAQQPSLTPAPMYQQPDYSSLIPPPQQSVSVTANPADTVFVPTARYNERVQAAKQAANDDAYRQYSSNLSIWNAQNEAAQNSKQQQLSALMNLLPYTEMTAAQKADLEMQKAVSMLKQQDTEINRAWDKFNAGVASDADYALLGITPGTLPLALAAKGGSGGGGYSGGSRSSGGAGYADNPGYYLDTQGERANVATGSLFDLATKQYEQNTRGGGNASQHPLYYTLNSLFNDSKWRTAATSSGANIKKVADALITKYSGKTPKDYFSAGRAKGSNIEAAYKQLLSQAERESWDDD